MIQFILGLGAGLSLVFRGPEMVKYLCDGIVQWKRFLDDVVNDPRGFEDEIDGSSATLEAQKVATTAPKFEDKAGAIMTPPGVQQTPPAPKIYPRRS